jgi:hypothetical protein
MATDLAAMEEALDRVAALPTPSRPTVLELLDGN